MRKALGLFLVIAICGTTAFAQNSGRKGDGRGERVTTSRSERMIADLKLDEKQATEFKKINDEYRKQLEQDRDAMRAERQAEREKQLAKMKELENQRNADMKKIMTDEQYKQFLDKQQQAQQGAKKRMQRWDLRGK